MPSAGIASVHPPPPAHIQFYFFKYVLGIQLRSPCLSRTLLAAISPALASIYVHQKEKKSKIYLVWICHQSGGWCISNSHECHFPPIILFWDLTVGINNISLLYLFYKTPLFTGGEDGNGSRGEATSTHLYFNETFDFDIYNQHVHKIHPKHHIF